MRIFIGYIFQDNRNFLELSRYVKSVRIRSFSVPHFPAFGLNTVIYRVNLCIQSEYRKMRTRKTSNTNIFHAVPDDVLKNTRNLLKILPLDFEKKWKLNPEKCFSKYQWTHVRLSLLCYFPNLFTLNRCFILRGD